MKRRFLSRLRLWSGSLRTFLSNRFAVAGTALIVLYGLAGAVYPLLLGTVWPETLYDPVFGFDIELMHPSPPGAGHLLGTDSLGRDVLSQLLAGTGSTWIMAVTAALTTAAVAVVVGALGAVFRGWVDGLLARVSDSFLLLPAPIFMLVIGASERSEQVGPFSFGFIYGVIVGFGAGAIVLRAQALKVAASPFVDSARVAGAGRWRVMTRHVIPHLLPLGALYMMLSVVGAIVADGFASFFGQTGTRVNWGMMVYYGIEFPDPVTGAPAWNVLLPPSIALSLFAAAFYLVSVGLREVADPRYRAAKGQFGDPTADWQPSARNG